MFKQSKGQGLRPRGTDRASAMSLGSVRPSSCLPTSSCSSGSNLLELFAVCLTQHCYSSHSHFGEVLPNLSTTRSGHFGLSQLGGNATGIKRVEIILQCKELQIFFFCRKNAKYCLAQNINIAAVDKPWVI